MEQDLEGAGRKKLPCALGRCPSWSFLEGKTGNYFKMANVQYTLLQKTPEAPFLGMCSTASRIPEANRRTRQKCSAGLFRTAH